MTRIAHGRRMGSTLSQAVRDSAGGTKLRFMDNSPQPYAELFLMKADGSGQRPITDDKWEEGTPAWVPEAVKDQGGNKQELPSVAENAARQ